MSGPEETGFSLLCSPMAPRMPGLADLKAFTATARLCTALAAARSDSCHGALHSGQVREWIKRGFKAAFLISGSVDGEVPERVARAYGAEVIRGSANQSGALALRDMQAMMKRGYSIITTADGPQGPQYEIKSGFLVMAKIGNVPIVPISCAAVPARSAAT